MNEVNATALSAHGLLLQRLVANLSPAYLKWPFGMPTSVAPRVVVIGASPENSPDPSALRRPTDGPTADGSPHPGLSSRNPFTGPVSSHWNAAVQQFCEIVKTDRASRTRVA